MVRKVFNKQKIRFYVIIIFLISEIFGCKNLSKETELIPTGQTISIFLSNETRNFTNCIRYFKLNKDSSYLVISNFDFNRIEFYDIKSGSLAFSINLMKHGPDGIGSLRGFEIVSRDSILVFNDMANSGLFFMVNSQGKILRKYNILSSEAKYPFVPIRPSSVMNNSIVVKNLIATIPSFVFYQLDHDEDISNCKLLARVNLSNGNSDILDLAYPVLYNKNHEQVSPDYSSTFAKDKWLFSFACSDDVFISGDLYSFQRINIRSRFVEKDFMSNSTRDNWDVNKIISSPLYKSFYFDSLNSVYYRFVKHGDEINSDKDFISQNRYPENTSVIILDDQLKIIGETKLPINRYVINMSFINPEGLFISTSNVYSSDYDENCMKFELFSLKR